MVAARGRYKPRKHSPSLARAHFARGQHATKHYASNQSYAEDGTVLLATICSCSAAKYIFATMRDVAEGTIPSCPGRTT